MIKIVTFKISIISYVCFNIIIIYSCKHDPFLAQDINKVCFKTQILPILENSCGMAGCHNSSAAESGFDATDYNSILSIVEPGNTKKSKLYQVITKLHGEGMMPPSGYPPVTEQNRMLINIWIEQGAQNILCNDNDTTPINGDTGSVDINPDSVCFVQKVQPLIVSGCAISGCHDAISRQEGYVLTDYNNIINKGVVPYNPDNSKIYKALSETGEDRMPPYPRAAFTNSQKEIIRQWIADGALNSDCPSATCDTAGIISFKTQVWPEINRACVGCHNTSYLSGGVNLSDYDHIKYYATTLRNQTPILLGVIKKSSGFIGMPPSGNMDGCDVLKTGLWIEQGSQNN